MRAASSRVIDVHAHAVPLSLLRWLETQGRAQVVPADEVVVLDPDISGVGRGARLPLPPSMGDPALRVEEMAAAGVTHEAVSLPPFLFASGSHDRDLVGEVVSRGNDALAAYCAHDPVHLLALGAVPLGWPGVVEEAVRCLDQLGMRGIVIGSRGGGRELDDPIHQDLWALLAERRVMTFLHPSGVPEAQRLRDFWLPQLLGYPMETAVAVTRLLFGGVLERHSFPLVLAHGGGCLPAVRGRLTMGWERKPVAHTTEAPPSELLDALFYDSAVFDPVALRRLVEDVGADHVVVGTDHPYDLAERDPIGLVAGAELRVEDTERVLHRTAARLLGLTDVPPIS